MSLPFPPVDLSSYPVGATGKILLANAGITSALGQVKTPAHLHIYNESGSGLQLTFSIGSSSYFLPAGGWQTYVVSPGESSLSFTVIYTLPAPPVTLLLLTYYGPNEPLPDIPQIGNSPIGIGGTVNTAATTELLNTGNAPGTAIISVAPSDAASNTWTADNSGNLTIRGDNAGTLTTLLQLIGGASPAVKLAAAAVLVEVLGNLTVDQHFTATGGSTVGGTGIMGAGGAINVGITATGDVFKADTVSGNTTVNSPTGNVVLSGAGGAGVVQVTSAGMNVFAGDLSAGHNVSIINDLLLNTTGATYNAIYGDTASGNTFFQVPAGTNAWKMGVGTLIAANGRMQLGVSAVNDVLDATTAAATFFKGATAINFQVPNGTTVMSCIVGGVQLHGRILMPINGSFNSVSTFTGTGIGNFNHNCGATPSICLFSGQSSSTATFGYSGINSTQVTVTSGGSIPWIGLAVQF